MSEGSFKDMKRREIVEGRAWKRQELGRLTTCMIAMYSAALIGCCDAFAVLPCNTEALGQRHRMLVKNTGPVPSACKILSIATFCQQTQGLVLSEPERGKDNPAPDEYFYDYPRICYHADNSWHAQLTNVYEEYLPYGDDLHVLDLMTSLPLPLWPLPLSIRRACIEVSLHRPKDMSTHACNAHCSHHSQISLSVALHLSPILTLCFPSFAR